MNSIVHEILYNMYDGIEECEECDAFHTFTKSELEKFAELIVKECINAIEESSECFTAEQVYIKKLALRNVKEHFGVE